MFDIGFWELGIVFVIALLVMARKKPQLLTSFELRLPKVLPLGATTRCYH